MGMGEAREALLREQMTSDKVEGGKGYLNDIL